MESVDIKEQKFLDEALEIINKDIKEHEKNCQTGIEDVRKLSKYHWERKSEMDEIEKAVTISRFDPKGYCRKNLINKYAYRLKRLSTAWLYSSSVAKTVCFVWDRAFPLFIITFKV